MDKIWVREMGETMDTRRVLEEGEGRERCLGLVPKKWSPWVLGVLGTMEKSGLVQIGTKFLNTTGEAPMPEGRSPDPSPRTGLVRWREYHSFSLIHSYSLSLSVSLRPPPLLTSPLFVLPLPVPSSLPPPPSTPPLPPDHRTFWTQISQPKVMGSKPPRS